VCTDVVLVRFLGVELGTSLVKDVTSGIIVIFLMYKRDFIVHMEDLRGIFRITTYIIVMGIP